MKSDSKSGSWILKLAICVIVLAGARTGAALAKVFGSGTSPAGSDILAEIAGYRNWAGANPSPVRFDSSISVLCAAQTPQPSVSAGPHADKFIKVYVNKIGREALLQQRSPRFPPGSVIVKEKLPSAESGSPELLTVMLKRNVGFNPQVGDWEFAVVNGDGKTVVDSGRLENCSACHVTRKSLDFVFRDYLPAQVKAALK